MQKLENFESTLILKQLATKANIIFEGYNATAEQIGDINLSISFEPCLKIFTSDTDRSSLM